jgi:hypothetical protein
MVTSCTTLKASPGHYVPTPLKTRYAYGLDSLYMTRISPTCTVDIFHFTLYWHMIFHAAIFGLTGAWFTFVALLSPTSSVGVRSFGTFDGGPDGGDGDKIRRARTDFRTNTEVAEEGALGIGLGFGTMGIDGEVDLDETNSVGKGKGRKGSASDNDAAKGGLRKRSRSRSRSRRGSGGRPIRGPGQHRDPLWTLEDEKEVAEEERMGGRSRRTSSADGLKIMDFAEGADDIPLRPTKSGLSRRGSQGGPSARGSSSSILHHPKPRHHEQHPRHQTNSLLSSHSDQSSELETHPSEAFADPKKGRLLRLPPRTPSPPSMTPDPEPDQDYDPADDDDDPDLTLNRPISHTDVPIPNQSQYSLHREEDLSREASTGRSQRALGEDGHDEQAHDRFGPIKSFFSSHREHDPDHPRSNHIHLHRSETGTTTGTKLPRHPTPRRPKPKHSRRPAPIWLAALPFPFFAVWGLTSAVIMSTIIGFVLSAVYNTAGFEMST